MTGFVQANSNNLPHLDIFMVHEFLKRDDRFNISEVKGSKASRSMRESYGDNAIGFVEVKRENNICTVRGKVCPEHNVRKTNYTVELLIQEEETVQDVHCNTCPASEGGCKHALAFLMWVHRRSEEPSPTEVTSYWQKPLLSKIGTALKFIEVKQLSSSSTNQKKTMLNNNRTFFNELIVEAKRRKINCQLTKYENIELEYDNLKIHKLVHKFKDESATLDFNSFQKFMLDSMQSAHIEAEKSTRGQNTSALWYELRYGRVTASKVYEVSKCKKVDGTLVSSIIGAHKVRATKAMTRGVKLEKRVLKVAEKQVSAKFKDAGLFIVADNPIFGASPDAITDDYVVEVKCPATAKSLETYIKNGKISNKYKAQLNLQMMATNKKKGLFVVAKPDFEISNEIIFLWLSYDEPFITDIVTNCKIFYEFHFK